MLSETVVLKCESTDRFLALIATLFEEFHPQTPFEESLIEDMAVARWRRMRVRGMEKASLDFEMSRQPDSTTAEDNATRAALAFRSLSDESRSLELINRYDSRYQREYLRAHRRFVEVRDRRTPPATPVGPVQQSEISKGTPEVPANKPNLPEPCTAGGLAAGALQPELSDEPAASPESSAGPGIKEPEALRIKVDNIGIS